MPIVGCTFLFGRNPFSMKMERNVARLGTVNKSVEEAATSAAYRRAQMELAYPNAAIEGYEALISTMTNHEKDRHVLAAAVRARVDLIVMANVKDFPENATAPYGIEAVPPDDFLMDLLGFDEKLVLEVIRDMTLQKTRPPMTDLEMLRRIAKSAPNFAAAALMVFES